MNHLSALRERLRTSLWFIPSLFAVAALIGGLVLVGIDQRLQTEGSAFYLYSGTPEGARNVLSTIAQSMLTFTGLVFTVTMLVLQLVSSQLSPRVLRTFLADRQNQVVLGMFVATFIYTLVVLRDVRSRDSGAEFVPSISVWVAFVLLAASVGAFIYYIDHMAHAIRASTVISNIAADTRAAIDRIYPSDAQHPSNASDEPERTAELRRQHSWRTVASDDAGVLVDVDEGALVDIASRVGVLVELVPTVGDFVPRGNRLFEVGGDQSGEEADKLESRLRDTLSFGKERTMQQDPAFGFRQLVDVGARALSPGTNDPTTAAQAIQRLHDLLLQLSDRPFPPAIVADSDGRPRLIMHHRTWEHFVRLAVDELRLYGERHIQVVHGLQRMLLNLVEHCPEDRLPIVRLELSRLEQQISALDENFGAFAPHSG